MAKKDKKPTVPEEYSEQYTTYELTTKTTFHKPFVMPPMPKIKKARESKPPTRSGKRTKQRYD